MTWIRRVIPAHYCAPPGRGVPAVPVAELDDLWRCQECRRLWRVGLACDWCDRYGDREHRGGHAMGAAWRPARFWQRLRYRNR